MQELFEIFYIFQIQKRIETINWNTLCFFECKLEQGCQKKFWTLILSLFLYQCIVGPKNIGATQRMKKQCIAAPRSELCITSTLNWIGMLITKCRAVITYLYLLLWKINVCFRLLGTTVSLFQTDHHHRSDWHLRREIICPHQFMRVEIFVSNRITFYF